MPASAAARETLTSGTAVPVRSLWPGSTLMSAKPRPEADHYTRDAAVADEEVGTKPDSEDRQVQARMGAYVLQEVGEVALVGGREQHLGWAAGAEPGDIGERRVGDQPPAKVRQTRFQVGSDVGKCHGKVSDRRPFSARPVFTGRGLG